MPVKYYVRQKVLYNSREICLGNPIFGHNLVFCGQKKVLYNIYMLRSDYTFVTASLCNSFAHVLGNGGPKKIFHIYNLESLFGFLPGLFFILWHSEVR